MGQKTSKNPELVVVYDATRCALPEENVMTLQGRVKEYTANSVYLENGNATNKHNKSSGDAPHSTSSKENVSSFFTVLNEAYAKHLQLALVMPMRKGSENLTLAESSCQAEESGRSPPNGTSSKANIHTNLSHTLIFSKPNENVNMKPNHQRNKKMMVKNNNSHFILKEFEGDIAGLSSGETVDKIEEIITTEACKGGRLLSVISGMFKDPPNAVLSNGYKNDRKSQKVGNASEKFNLKMLFLHKLEGNDFPSFEYTVACFCKRAAGKTLKKNDKQNKSKVSGTSNMPLIEDWLDVIKEKARLVDVVNTENSTNAKPKNAKAKLSAAYILCFYEKRIVRENRSGGIDNTNINDERTNADCLEDYEGMVREAWTPMDSIQSKVEKQALAYGQFGWELRAMLQTTKNVMKNESKLLKLIIFFQRLKKECVFDDEDYDDLDNSSQEDGLVLVESSNEPQPEYLDHRIPPTSPIEKAQKFGIPVMFERGFGSSQNKPSSFSNALSQSRVQESDSSGDMSLVSQEETAVRNKMRNSSLFNQDALCAQQAKLRHTIKESNIQKKEAEDVPWSTLLKKKRNAVLKREETFSFVEKSNSGDAQGEFAQKIDKMKQRRLKSLSGEGVEKAEAEIENKKNEGLKKENPIQRFGMDDKNICKTAHAQTDKTELSQSAQSFTSPDDSLQPKKQIEVVHIHVPSYYHNPPASISKSLIQFRPVESTKIQKDAVESRRLTTNVSENKKRGASSLLLVKNFLNTTPSSSEIELPSDIDVRNRKDVEELSSEKQNSGSQVLPDSLSSQEENVLNGVIENINTIEKMTGSKEENRHFKLPANNAQYKSASKDKGENDFDLNESGVLDSKVEPCADESVKRNTKAYASKVALPGMPNNNSLQNQKDADLPHLELETSCTTKKEKLKDQTEHFCTQEGAKSKFSSSGESPNTNVSEKESSHENLEKTVCLNQDSDKPQNNGERLVTSDDKLD